jgi:hypothetical protein
MKKLAIIFAMVLSTSAFALEPNFIRCENVEQDLYVSYQVTSYAGVPMFSVGNGEKETSTSDIEIQKSKIGDLVHAVDAVHTSTYTLVLPEIELKGEGDVIDFGSMVARSSEVYTLVPDDQMNTVQEYTAVNCQASFVYF